MSAILAVCGDTFCAMVSDGRYVEEPIPGDKPHILKNDLPKVRKINRNVVVGFAGDTLAAVQIINAVDEYQTQYLTLEKVVKILREKGELKAQSKIATRIAADGLVDVMKEGDTTAIIEVNSETDFVAKNELFREFVKNLLKTIIANKPADVEALMSCKYAGEDCTVDEKLKEMIFKIGEKLSIRRFAVTEGITSTYIHGIGSIGVIVRFDTDVAAYKTIPQVYNITLKSLYGMSADDVAKFYENNCLLDMEYFLEDSMKVGQYIEKTAKELGGKIVVAEMYRFEKGEGIQKKEEDFAAEIEKLAGGNK